MHRSLSLALVITLVLEVALAACNPFAPRSEPTATPTATSTATATLVPTFTSTATSTPSPTEKPTPTATSTPPTTLEPTATPTSSSPKPPRMDSPEYGMQAFLWWRPETAERDLDLIKEAGFGWVKQNFGWRDIEGAGKGIFDWSRTDRIVEQVDSRGLKLVVRVDFQPWWAGGGDPNGPPDDYDDYGDFLYALASRYRGRIHAYEVWNEPNLAREWGGKPPNPAEYVALLKVAYQAIKRADPQALVISAGLTPTTRWDEVAMPDVVYLEQMYAAGAKPYFDVLGVHGAGYKAPPEMDPAVVASDPTLNNYDPTDSEELKRIYCFRHVEDLREVMVENGDADKQVVVLEFGWTTDLRLDSPYHWHAVSEEEQADYLVRAYQYAKEHWSPWIGLMSLIYISDPDWASEDEQYWWAITRPSYPIADPRPAYTALKEMSK